MRGERNTIIFYGICFVLAGSFIFNLNGFFWDNVINPYYTLVLILILGFIAAFISTNAIRLHFVDIGIIALLLHSIISRAIVVSDFFDVPMLLSMVLIVYYISLKKTDWNPSVIARLITILTILGFILAFHGFLQYVGVCVPANALFKITGTFFNPGPFGGALAFFVPISVLFFLENRTKNRVFAVIPVFIFFVVGLTESRTAIVGAIISGICAALFYYDVSLKNRRLILACLLLVVPAIIVVVFTKGMDSVTGRTLIWKIALHMLADHPFFGIGYHFFEVDYLKYQSLYFASHSQTNKEAMLAGSTYYAFNETLRFLVECGIIGLLILLATIFFAIKQYGKSNIRNNAVLKSLVLSPLTAFFIFSQFSYPFCFLFFKLLVLMHLAIFSGHLQGLPAVTIKSVYIKGFIITLTSFCLFSAIFSYKSVLVWKKHEHSFPALSIIEYEKVAPFLGSNGQFLYSYGAFMEKFDLQQATLLMEQASRTFSHHSLYSRMGKNYELSGKYPEAEERHITAVYMVPGELEPKEALFDFYITIGNTLKALEWAKNIADTPKRNEDYETKKMRMKAEIYLQQ